MSMRLCVAPTATGPQLYECRMNFIIRPISNLHLGLACGIEPLCLAHLGHPHSHLLLLDALTCPGPSVTKIVMMMILEGVEFGCRVSKPGQATTPLRAGLLLRAGLRIIDLLLQAWSLTMLCPAETMSPSWAWPLRLSPVTSVTVMIIRDIVFSGEHISNLDQATAQLLFIDPWLQVWS